METDTHPTSSEAEAPSAPELTPTPAPTPTPTPAPAATAPTPAPTPAPKSAPAPKPAPQPKKPVNTNRPMMACILAMAGFILAWVGCCCGIGLGGVLGASSNREVFVDITQVVTQVVTKVNEVVGTKILPTPTLTDTPATLLPDSTEALPASTEAPTETPANTKAPTVTETPSSTKNPGITETPSTAYPPPPDIALTAMATMMVPATCTCQEDILDCKAADFTTLAVAQACFDYCMAEIGEDVYKLDEDGDGKACEDGLE